MSINGIIVLVALFVILIIGIIGLVMLMTPDKELEKIRKEWQEERAKKNENTHHI